MKKNDGKDFELLVELVERSISSDSRIERDVKLPVLASASGKKEQCDVIIRTGTPPRETITLIEAQDRTSRVKPNDFRGWLKKLHDVGAQHLICVSRQPFPESIKEAALREGGTVRLVNVKELGLEDIPTSIFDFRSFQFTLQRFYLSKIHSFVVGASEENLALRNAIEDIYSHDANGFSLDAKNTISFSKLCSSLIKREDYASRSGRALYQKAPDSFPPIFYRIDDQFVNIGVEFDFEWKVDALDIPISLFSYEQLNHGSLAWVVEAKLDSPDGKLSIKIPLVKTGDSAMFNAMLINSPYDDGYSLDFSVNNRLRERFVHSRDSEPTK